VFSITPKTGRVYNLSLQNYYLDKTATLCYFIQVEQYLVIQDGENPPIILDGSVIRRSNTREYEVPAGTIMAYGQGRLFVKVGERAVAAGDIYDPGLSGSVLKFKELRSLELGGLLTVKDSIGTITAMSFASNFDTSSGDGALLISGRRGFTSFAVNNPRENWSKIAFSKLQIQGTGAGTVGHRAIKRVNSDILFWSSEGLKSYAVLRAELTRNRSFVDLSREVASVTSGDTPWLNKFMSFAYFDGRLLMTTNIKKHKNRSNYQDDYCFRGLLSLDFKQISAGALQGRYVSNVSYDGIWTGFDPLEVLTGTFDAEEKCFMFCKTKGKNTMHSILKTGNGWDGDKLIHCRMFTRAFPMKAPPDFYDVPFIFKTLTKISLWVKSVTRNTDIKCYVSSDNKGFKLTSVLSLAIPEGDDNVIPYLILQILCLEITQLQGQTFKYALTGRVRCLLLEYH